MEKEIKVNIWISFWCYLNKHINFLVGALAGIATGTIVFFINYECGIEPAFHSFLKQFAFNFFIGGFNTRMCEKLARNIDHKFWNLLGGTAIPTIQAFTILFSIHYFGLTPKPGASTLWQLPANIVIFFCTTLYYRSLQYNENQDTRLHKIQDIITESRIVRIGLINKKVG